MAEFLMPALGTEMTSGKLIAWHKRPGDAVARGDIIAEVETDKAVIEVECFATGILEKTLFEPGAVVPVGTAMAIIREAEETAPPRTGPAAAREPAPPAEAPAEAARLRVSPAARKLAADLGVDLSTIQGTGPQGAVTREDVARAAPKAVGGAPGSPLRSAIAAAMTRSKREIPHYYLATTIDMGAALAWITAANSERAVPDRLLPGVLFIKAVALALRDVPELNGFWKDGRGIPSDRVHVGVAISLRSGGVVAPALHDVDRLPLGELMRSFRDLVTRARGGTLRSSELVDATITITSLGEKGAETVFGVIHPPQVALVGFGRIVKRPAAVEDAIQVRPMVSASLSADHRVTDGHRGSKFLSALDRLLQAPEGL